MSDTRTDESHHRDPGSRPSGSPGSAPGSAVLNGPLDEETAHRMSRLVMDQTPDSIFWILPDTRIVYANEVAAASLGYSREELMSMRVHDIDPTSPGKDEMRADWERLRRTGSRHFSGLQVRRDGTSFPIEGNASLVSFEGTEYAIVLTRDVSERERAERRLRASEERYRALYEDNPTMYFTVNPEGTVLSVNRFGADQLGYSVEELVGEPVLKIFHPDDKEAVATQLADCVAAKGESRNWEFRKVTKSGRTMWVREAARTVQDSNGNLIVLIVCEDITDRRNMEEALQKAHDELEVRVRERTADLTVAVNALRSEIGKREQVEAVLRHERDLLHTLMHHLPEHIYFKDTEGRYTRISKALAEFYGLGDPAEAEGKSDSDFHSAADAAEYRRDEREIMRSGTSLYDKIERCQTLSRRVAFFSTTKCPLYDRDDRVVGVFGISTDVTKTKLAERKFRALLESAPDAMIMVNEDGRIVLVNRQALTVFGYERRELVDEPFEVLLPDRYQGAEHRRRTRLFRNPATAARNPGLPLHGRRRDGSEFPVEITLSPIETEDELLLACAIRDVTLRRSLEKEIADLVDREYYLVARELHDSVRQDMAAAAYLATAVKSRVEEAAPTETETMATLVKSIQDAEIELRDLARGLLPVEIDANGLMGALQDQVDRAQVRYDVDCIFDCTKPVPIEDNFVATHLYRIAQEAITNAVKHGMAKHIVVALRSEEGRISLEIRDDGRGMPEESSPTPGMGLRMIEHRAGVIGADFQIDSKPGQGTVLTCLLRAVAKEPSTSA